ncbi:Anthocyanin 5-aromatic acyltransferase [Hordeum vulgare]|nr:Anthocyanin 5-aromatic acyltransferase [Hordeum vulgare]
MRYPKAEAASRKFARLCAPDLPTVNTMPELDWARQSRRTYLLDAGQIQSLKRRIAQQRQSAGTDGENQPPPSTYVAVASLLWTSMARAKHPDPAANASDPSDDDAYLLFPADCRRRMRPPMDPGFFGNCVKLCFARGTASKLLCRDDDDGALAHAAGALRRAIREQVEEKDPLGDADRWAETYQGIPPERRSQQGSSHRFMAYEVDFGWGQPSRAEIVSMYSPEVAMLVGGPHGAVEVSVALGRDLIDGFEACFMSLLSAYSR